jgi:hypothetical protein
MVAMLPHVLPRPVHLVLRRRPLEVGLTVVLENDKKRIGIPRIIIVAAANSH